MAVSTLELYDKLKINLGESETKALIEYVDGKIQGEVATKEDVYLVKEEVHLLREEALGTKSDLENKINGLRVEVLEKINGLRTENKNDIQGLRMEINDEIWKLKILVIVVLVVTVVLNPNVVEFAGKILGIGK